MIHSIWGASQSSDFIFVKNTTNSNISDRYGGPKVHFRTQGIRSVSVHFPGSMDLPPRSNSHPSPCMADGCVKSFGTAAAKRKHYTNCHSYTPEVCDKGCNLSAIFPTQTLWKTHIAAEHGGFPKDFPCTVPGCTSTTPFNKAQNLTQHLVKCHALHSPEARLPYVSFWRPRLCPEPNCKKTNVFQKPPGLVNHMLKEHHRDVSSDRSGMILSLYTPDI